MATNLSSNVADLSDEQRRILESVIGQPLQSDQTVHWFVASPGRQPTAADRAAARSGLERVFSKVDRYLDQNHIEQAEWEATVDEAIRHVRSQPNE
ncbi:MAG TPA: hypothetical protein VJ783_09955 [Pirellulales bacterium]|nr:hypothetical protein [Pirellulales bacterium]